MTTRVPYPMLAGTPAAVGDGTRLRTSPGRNVSLATAAGASDAGSATVIET